MAHFSISVCTNTHLFVNIDAISYFFIVKYNFKIKVEIDAFKYQIRAVNVVGICQISAYVTPVTLKGKNESFKLRLNERLRFKTVVVQLFF